MRRADAMGAQMAGKGDGLETHFIRHQCGHWFCWRVERVGDADLGRLLGQDCPMCQIESGGSEWQAAVVALLKRFPGFFC